MTERELEQEHATLQEEYKRLGGIFENEKHKLDRLASRYVSTNKLCCLRRYSKYKSMIEEATVDCLRDDWWLLLNIILFFFVFSYFELCCIFSSECFAECNCSQNSLHRPAVWELGDPIKYKVTWCKDVFHTVPIVVKPVWKTTCIEQPQAVRHHCPCFYRLSV